MSESNSNVEWREVVGFPGYIVSSTGQVARLLVPQKCKKSGYMRVHLSRDRKQLHRLVQRLVLAAFVGPCPDGMEACHDPDNDRTNNNLANLRWGTKAENMQDRARHGNTRHGCSNGSAKLTMEQLEDARQDYAAGVTFSDLVKKFGVSQNRLRRAIRGRSYGQYGTPAAVRPRTERGEKHHASKLTAEIVVNIRVRYAAGERQTALAREYNVSQPSVRAIILGKTWTHAGGPIAEPKRRKAK